MPLFPAVMERTVGTRLDVAPVRTDFGDEPAAWRVEIADAGLHGIPGLRTDGVRASGRVHAIILGASIVNVSSPVGPHARGMVEAGCRIGGGWQGAVRAGAERLALVGTAPITWRVVGAVSRIDVGRVSTLADIEVIAGHRRYETSLSISTRVRAGAAQLVGVVGIDGDRFAGAAVSVMARIHPSLALVAGYDDGTQSMRAGVIVDWKGVEIGTAVSQHPVLGLSQGVSVACAR